MFQIPDAKWCVFFRRLLLFFTRNRSRVTSAFFPHQPEPGLGAPPPLNKVLCNIITRGKQGREKVRWRKNSYLLFLLIVVLPWHQLLRLSAFYLCLSIFSSLYFHFSRVSCSAFSIFYLEDVPTLFKLEWNRLQWPHPHFHFVFGQWNGHHSKPWHLD